MFDGPFVTRAREIVRQAAEAEARMSDAPPASSPRSPGWSSGHRLRDAIRRPVIRTLMGDFGADVIKVEHPTGDPLRNMGAKKNGHGLWWKTAARNKRCIALDLKTPDDAEIFKALVAEADVLVENFRTGTLECWGLGWDDLSEINPRLVMVRVTGFGQTGPYKRRAGFGTLAEAMSGFAHITGQPDGPPTLPPFGLADGIAAYFGCFATMFAIYDRDVRGSGKGQFIDLAIYEPIFALLGPQPIIFDQLGIIQNRTGNRSVNNAPRNAYRTRDNRWVALSAAAPSIVRRVLELTGGPEAANDPRFQTNSIGSKCRGDRRDRRRMDCAARSRVKSCRRSSRSRRRSRRSTTSSRSSAIPSFSARESIVTVADEDLGPVRMQNVFPRLSRTPGAIRFAGARIDQHREEILDRTRNASRRMEPRLGTRFAKGRARTANERGAAPPRIRRDLVGYADRRPQAHWPGGARIAVQFAINYEEGSEYTVADGDGRTELGLAEAPGGRVPAGQRDLAFETMYEFGSRVGVWRLFRLFAERGLPVTILAARSLSSAIRASPRRSRERATTSAAMAGAGKSISD